MLKKDNIGTIWCWTFQLIDSIAYFFSLRKIILQLMGILLRNWVKGQTIHCSLPPKGIHTYFISYMAFPSICSLSSKCWISITISSIFLSRNPKSISIPLCNLPFKKVPFYAKMKLLLDPCHQAFSKSKYSSPSSHIFSNVKGLFAPNDAPTWRKTKKWSDVILESDQHGTISYFMAWPRESRTSIERLTRLQSLTNSDDKSSSKRGKSNLYWSPPQHQVTKRDKHLQFPQKKVKQPLSSFGPSTKYGPKWSCPEAFSSCNTDKFCLY